MARYDDLPIPRITAVSVIAIAVTLVSVLAVQVLYYGMQRYIDQTKISAGSYVESEEILARQRRSISRYGVTEQEGNYVIPIEQAMRKIVREASAKHENQPATSTDI